MFLLNKITHNWEDLAGLISIIAFSFMLFRLVVII